ncbi:MAG: ammonia-forming cytochrome c nitrite reductase subunit c552 [Polyangiales bacterium]
MQSDPRPGMRARYGTHGLVTVAVAVVASATTALLMDIFAKEAEVERPCARVVEVGEDDTDPAKWAANWPLQYDGYRRTAPPSATRFGGHGGSEALPDDKRESDPWLERMFLGYALAPAARARRGHAHMLTDQEASKGLQKPQSGSCLHCHASVMPLYRSLGDGDAMVGFSRSYTHSHQDLSQKLHASGHAHPVSCVDCHDPKTMGLRVTRPGFLRAVQALASSTAPMPALPSIEVWRRGERDQPYDPNVDASRVELRSFVCGQCHVEYACASKVQLSIPWAKGLRAEDIEQVWDETETSDGQPFYDFTHEETGARALKAQHPQFELWSQGIHARSGVGCTDCHMPFMREGASKVSDHRLRSPMQNVSRACQTCHRFSEAELTARVAEIQSRNHTLLQRGGEAIVALIGAIASARAAGASEVALATPRALQRRAQWRLDFVSAENSMGFHAPQEAARLLAEAIDHARLGQLFAMAIPLASEPEEPAPRPRAKADSP